MRSSRKQAANVQGGRDGARTRTAAALACDGGARARLVLAATAAPPSAVVPHHFEVMHAAGSEVLDVLVLGGVPGSSLTAMPSDTVMTSMAKWISLATVVARIGRRRAALSAAFPTQRMHAAFDHLSARTNNSSCSDRRFARRPRQACREPVVDRSGAGALLQEARL